MDISLNFIKIEDPKLNENTYTFGLSYNNENFMVNSKNDYILNKLNQELFILNKNELKFFYNFRHLGVQPSPTVYLQSINLCLQKLCLILI